MTLNRPRPPRDRGVRTGVFSVDGRSLEAPCAAVLAEELRKIADPQVAVVWLESAGTEPDDISIANPGGLVRSDLEGVAAWLSGVKSTQTVEVPLSWQSKLQAATALAVPVLSPIVQLGVAAFPVQSNFELIRREAEHCLSDFALRLERYQRLEQLRELQRRSRPDAPPSLEGLEPAVLKIVSNG